MNNTIEFVLRMKDLMSSNITRVSSSSQSAFNRMSQSASQMTSRNQVLSMSFSELQNKIRDVENTISRSTVPSQIAAARRELASLQAMSNRHAGNVNGGGSGSGSSRGIGIGGIAVGSMIGGLVSGGLTMVAGAVTSGIGAMIAGSMDKEMAISGMSTFIGKDGAKDAYSNIQKDAEATPFDTASLLQVNRSLISAGLNAKSARTDSMNLANAIVAVGGSNDTLTRMAANMQQIKTVGKATAMDIRQFGIAGINIYAMLAQSTGKSIEQVKEMDVTYEQLAKSMAMASGKGGIYENALNIAMDTETGKWSNFKESITNQLTAVGDAFKPVRMQLLDLGIKFTSSISAGLIKAQPYIEAFSNSIGRGVDYIMDIVNGTSEWNGWVVRVQEVFSGIWSIAVKMQIKIWELIGSMLDFIKKSEILKDVFSILGGILQFAGVLLSSFVDLISWVWNNVLKPILEKLDAAYKWLKGTKDIEVKSTKTIIAPKPKDPKDPKNSPLDTGSAIMATNNASGKTAGDTVTGAGPKVVNIHVGKFFDSIQFTTMNGNESAQELEKIVMECFARVVYNGSKLV